MFTQYKAWLEEQKEYTTRTDTMVAEYTNMSRETALRMSAEESVRNCEISMNAVGNNEHKPNRMYLLVLREGSILRPRLSKETAVCVVANACGKTAYASSGVLEREYVHADLYRSRRRMFSTSIAITAGRDRTGTVAIRSGDAGPTIIYLIAQIWTWQIVGERAMKQLKSSTERHYVAGLTSD